MKTETQKNIPVKEDEKYLDGINLVTGDRIDYARHILVNTQLLRPKHKSKHSVSAKNYQNLKNSSRSYPRDRKYKNGHYSRTLLCTLNNQKQQNRYSLSLK